MHLLLKIPTDQNSKEDTVEEIVRCSGTQFAPAVVEALLGWVSG
jgi:HD-GYP domain-containing protein (c-di-GMP phosphodiesterase class II)